MTVVSVFVMLKLGKGEIAHVHKSDGKMNVYRLTRSSYKRLERIAVEFQKINWMCGRLGMRNYSIAILRPLEAK